RHRSELDRPCSKQWAHGGGGYIHRKQDGVLFRFADRDKQPRRIPRIRDHARDAFEARVGEHRPWAETASALISERGEPAAGAAGHHEVRPAVAIEVCPCRRRAVTIEAPWQNPL